MSNVMAYFIGLGTLPAAWVVFVVIESLFSRSTVVRSWCTVCPDSPVRYPSESRLPHWASQSIPRFLHVHSREHRARSTK